jgi:two-component SAPR family response regulator
LSTSTGHAATRIQLCGEFVVELEGRQLEAAIPGRQARTLLSYLVLHRRRPVRREELIEILWPDACPASPESALSTIVSRLRKVVGREVLCGRSELRFHLAADAQVDFEYAFEEIERAEQALERNAWEDATSCADAALAVALRGFLPEVDVGWAEDERRRLHEVSLRALECLAVCGLALGGSHLSAAEPGRRALEITGETLRMLVELPGFHNHRAGVRAVWAELFDDPERGGFRVLARASHVCGALRRCQLG